MRFDARAAIVTGAAGGMGEAIAQRLASEGAQVLSVDLPSKITGRSAQSKRGIIYAAFDLGDGGVFGPIVEAAMHHFGRIDILVNCAGIVGEMGADGFGSDENWRRVMAVNVDAVRHLSRACVPHLRKSPAGRIINIGSVNSEIPAPLGSAYVASKHAVYGLTKCMAFDLGQYGITVNAVLPGAVDSPMSRGFTHVPFDAWAAYAVNKSPLKQVGKPEDIAAAVAFLASDEASFITALGMYVDGGIHVSPL